MCLLVNFVRNSEFVRRLANLLRVSGFDFFHFSAFVEYYETHSFIILFYPTLKKGKMCSRNVNCPEHGHVSVWKAYNWFSLANPNDLSSSYQYRTYTINAVAYRSQPNVLLFFLWSHCCSELLSRIKCPEILQGCFSEQWYQWGELGYIIPIHSSWNKMTRTIFHRIAE